MIFVDFMTASLTPGLVGGEASITASSTRECAWLLVQGRRNMQPSSKVPVCGTLRREVSDVTVITGPEGSLETIKNGLEGINEQGTVTYERDHVKKKKKILG